MCAKSRETRERLAREMDRIPLVSTHAHFEGAAPYESVDSFWKTTVLYQHLSGRWRPPVPDGGADTPMTPRSEEETHQHVFRVRMMVRVLQETFGYEEELLTRDGIAKILPRLNEIRGDDDVAAMHRTLDLANIDVQVIDQLALGQCTERLRTARRFENELTWQQARKAGTSFDACLATRADLVRAWAAEPAVATLKLPFAYVRTLNVTNPSEAEARSAYDTRTQDLDSVAQRTIEDFLIRHGLRQCSESGLPVQIHTGFGWSSGRPLRLADADVGNLVPLFEDAAFRDVRFLIFHGSWPYTQTMGYLAASFENVYLDFNCMVALSREMTGRALSEWLDVVPLHKMMTGTDGPYLEWWIATARETRRVLAEVLEHKVSQGLYSEETALDAARAILNGNAREALDL